MASTSPAPATCDRPLLDYGIRRRRGFLPRIWRLLPPALVVIAGLALLVVITMPSLNARGGEDPARIKCASNLRQIGQAIYIYAADHGGRFPASMTEVLLACDVTSAEFVCPASGDATASGARAAQAAALAGVGSCSYVYLGKGLTSRSPASAVLAHERVGHHVNGTNVLFADGHVEWITGKDLPRLLAGPASQPTPEVQP